MKTHSSFRKRGFTLLETVIAIGVLAVLLTGFMIVFAPAAAGIRKSINVQEADRLASTVEQELVTFEGRRLEENRIRESLQPDPRNPIPQTMRFGLSIPWKPQQPAAGWDTGSQCPMSGTSSPARITRFKPWLRSKSDPNFREDLAAVEGGIYLGEMHPARF